jgi:hypothetical protein
MRLKIKRVHTHTHTHTEDGTRTQHSEFNREGNVSKFVPQVMKLNTEKMVGGPGDVRGMHVYIKIVDTYPADPAPLACSQHSEL